MWYELAFKVFHCSVAELKSKLSVEEFLGWQGYLTEQWNVRDKRDWYFAKLISSFGGGSIEKAFLHFYTQSELEAQLIENLKESEKELIPEEDPDINIVPEGFTILEG